MGKGVCVAMDQICAALHIWSIATQTSLIGTKSFRPRSRPRPPYPARPKGLALDRYTPWRCDPDHMLRHSPPSRGLQDRCLSPEEGARGDLDHGGAHPMGLAVRGHSTECPVRRGVRGLRPHAEGRPVADAMIETEKNSAETVVRKQKERSNGQH
jgi:hypothetical protein